MAKYVDISLDRSRRLRYTINGIRELERHFGASFTTLFTGANLGFEQIIMLLTVGLKHGDTEKKPLSDTKVGELVQDKWLENGKDLSELVNIILDAMAASGIITRDEKKTDEESSSGGGGKKELPNA
jgi:hypothetical protein